MNFKKDSFQDRTRLLIASSVAMSLVFGLPRNINNLEGKMSHAVSTLWSTNKEHDLEIEKLTKLKTGFCEELRTEFNQRYHALICLIGGNIPLRESNSKGVQGRISGASLQIQERLLPYQRVHNTSGGLIKVAETYAYDRLSGNIDCDKINKIVTRLGFECVHDGSDKNFTIRDSRTDIELINGPAENFEIKGNTVEFKNHWWGTFRFTKKGAEKKIGPVFYPILSSNAGIDFKVIKAEAIKKFGLNNFFSLNGDPIHIYRVYPDDTNSGNTILLRKSVDTKESFGGDEEYFDGVLDEIPVWKKLLNYLILVG